MLGIGTRELRLVEVHDVTRIGMYIRARWSSRLWLDAQRRKRKKD